MQTLRSAQRPTAWNGAPDGSADSPASTSNYQWLRSNVDPEVGDKESFGLKDFVFFTAEDERQVHESSSSAGVTRGEAPSAGATPFTVDTAKTDKDSVARFLRHSARDGFLKEIGCSVSCCKGHKPGTANHDAYFLESSELNLGGRRNTVDTFVCCANWGSVHRQVF